MTFILVVRDIIVRGKISTTFTLLATHLFQSGLSETNGFLIMAVVAILGSLPAVFLPETADQELPETLEDMKSFGKKDFFFWMPCMKNTPRFKKENIGNDTNSNSIFWMDPHRSTLEVYDYFFYF